MRNCYACVLFITTPIYYNTHFKGKTFRRRKAKAFLVQGYGNEGVDSVRLSLRYAFANPDDIAYLQLFKFNERVEDPEMVLLQEGLHILLGLHHEKAVLQRNHAVRVALQIVKHFAIAIEHIANIPYFIRII